MITTVSCLGPVKASCQLDEESPVFAVGGFWTFFGDDEVEMEMLSNSRSNWPADPDSLPLSHDPVIKPTFRIDLSCCREGRPPCGWPRHDCAHEEKGTVTVRLTPHGVLRSSGIGHTNCPFFVVGASARVKLEAEVGDVRRRGLALVLGVDAVVNHDRAIHAGRTPITHVVAGFYVAKSSSIKEPNYVDLAGPRSAFVRHLPGRFA